MKKPDLLLLHGALGASNQFSKIQELINSDFNVHKIDFSGHGQKSSQNNGFGIEHFANEVEEYLKANNLTALNIFGYSMGGYVALWLAHKNPGSVNKIFTLATKFDWNPAVAAAEKSKLNPEKVQQKIPHFAEYLQTLHGANWPVLMRNTAELLSSLGENPLITTEILQNINITTRVAVGDRDTMVNISETEKAYRSLPNGQMQVFPNTPHPLEKVAVIPFSNALKEFFLS